MAYFRLSVSGGVSAHESAGEVFDAIIGVRFNI
jgi:hypothetical protein